MRSVTEVVPGLNARLVVGAVACVLMLVAGPGGTAFGQEAPGEFDFVRQALREKFGLRMDIVADWSWEQVNFDDGIESCLAEGERQGRTAPWGRVYRVDPGNRLTYEVRISFDQNIIIACDNPDHAAWAASLAAPPPPEPQPQPEAEEQSAPAEAPAVAANLPAPVAGAASIGTFQLGGHVNNMTGPTFGYMERAGMTWVKKQLRYNLGDSPEVAAEYINNAHANGYRILLGIVGNPGQMWDFPAYVESYSQFVGGVAALGADAIEVWNEPNIDREWPADSISGARYTELLAAAYNAIKSANGGTLVVSGAPAPTGYFGGCGAGGCDDDVFMQQMANAGAGRYMDCVGLHYNEGIISPSRTSGDPRGGYPTYYFNSMLARGYNLFGGKKVCFTELGYLSGEGYAEPIPGHFGWAANTTVAQHAAWLAEAATIAARSGKVAIMIVWNIDYNYFSGNDPLGGYAIVRPDGSCPACDTLGTVMR